MHRASVPLACLCLAALAGCGSSRGGAADADDAAGDSGGSIAAEDVPVTPLKPAPPELSGDENKELGALCAPIEPLLYDAGKQAVAVTESELAKGSADAEQKGLAAGLAMLKDPQEGLGAADLKRCTELFSKQTKRRLHEYEPAEVAARAALKSCVERAVAAFGKTSMDFDMGGSGQGAAAQQGPFCPDDFPVPQNLRELPYKSTAEDWNANTWRCLQFGLRGEQPFQIEYAAPLGEGTFLCIARYLPRQGGAPIELLRGGKVNEQGELMVNDKVDKRRMNAVSP
jgi:hypothetical protein